MPLHLLRGGGSGALTLSIVAVDARCTASSTMVLPPTLPHFAPSSTAHCEAAAAAAAAVSGGGVIPVRDLTAATGALDPDSHVCETARVAALPPGGTVSLTAVGSARVEAYGSLDRAFGLMAGVGGNSTLPAEFAWLLKWPTLTHSEKVSSAVEML